jgi:hypothetical protein
VRTTISLEQDEDGAWKEEPSITVSHDEPLTDDQVQAFRDLGLLAARATDEQTEAVEGYAPGMREEQPHFCWRLLAGERCCIRDRGHDGGVHEP